MSIKFDLKKILVPTDFSTLSLSALHYAAKIAKHSDAEIVLLHVMETYEQNVELNAVIDLDKLVQEAVDKKLTELKNQNIDLWGIPIRVELQKGKVYSRIRKYVRDSKVDLVVMGTQGAKSISRSVLGTNASRTVQFAACPVITISREQDKPDFKKLVLPLDTTKETKQKVDAAIKIAKVFGSEIHLVSVSTYLEEFTGGVGRLEVDLKEVGSRITEEGIAVKVKTLRYESVATAVMEYSQKIDADLVLIMTRQEGRLNDMFIGSSARKLISESKVPILSFQPDTTQWA